MSETRAQRWVRENPSQTFERGPLGLTLWSRPATWAFSLRAWRWVLDYHPLTGRQAVAVSRRKLAVGHHLFLLRRWAAVLDPEEKDEDVS